MALIKKENGSDLSVTGGQIPRRHPFLRIRKIRKLRKILRRRKRPAPRKRTEINPRALRERGTSEIRAIHPERRQRAKKPQRRNRKARMSALPHRKAADCRSSNLTV